MLRRSRIGLGVYFSLVITHFCISSIAVEAMLPDVAEVASLSSPVSLNPGSMSSIASAEQSSLTSTINQYKASRDLLRCSTDSTSTAPCYKYDRNLNFQGIYFPPSMSLKAGEDDDAILPQESTLDKWCSSLDGGQLCRTAGTFIPRQAKAPIPSTKPTAEADKSDKPMPADIITIEAAKTVDTAGMGSIRRISKEDIINSRGGSIEIDIRKPSISSCVHHLVEDKPRILNSRYYDGDDVLLDHNIRLKAPPVLPNKQDNEPFLHFPNPTLLAEDGLYIGHMDPYGVNGAKHHAQQQMKEALSVRKVQTFTNDGFTVNEEYVAISSVRINPGGLRDGNKLIAKYAMKATDNTVGMIMPHPADKEDTLTATLKEVNEEGEEFKPIFTSFEPNPHERVSHRDGDGYIAGPALTVITKRHRHTCAKDVSSLLDHGNDLPNSNYMENISNKKKKKKDCHSDSDNSNSSFATIFIPPAVFFSTTNNLANNPANASNLVHIRAKTSKSSTTDTAVAVVEAIRELKNVVQEKFTAEMEQFFYGNIIASAA